MLETARDQAFPSLQQISFFLANKVGSLERVAKELEAERVRICGLSILDAHDHAVVRLIVDNPGKAEQILVSRGNRVCSSSVLGVVLSPASDSVGKLLGALLGAELNVYYTYALLTQHADGPIVALHADHVDTAARVLRSRGFNLVGQRDLES